MERRPYETLDELKATGASYDQLREWRRQQLLPRPLENPGLGQGGGSESRYPFGTARTARRIQQLLGIRRSYAYAGWKLWVEGYPVAGFVQDALRDWGETLGPRARKLEKHLEKALDHPPLMEYLKPPRGLGWIRLTLTDEHFPWLLRIITEAYKGNNAGIWGDGRDSFKRLIGNMSNRIGLEPDFTKALQSDADGLVQTAATLLPSIATFVSQLSLAGR